MARTTHAQIRVSLSLRTDATGDCEYRESFGIPVPSRIDHIEALAIVVTEVAHFEASARKALATGIVVDIVGPQDAVPAVAP